MKLLFFTLRTAETFFRNCDNLFNSDIAPCPGGFEFETLVLGIPKGDVRVLTQKKTCEVEHQLSNQWISSTRDF